MSEVGDEKNNFSDLEESEMDSSEDCLKESLKVQVSECEMIQSMFPNSDEFSLDCGILVEIEDYVSGKTAEKPPRLNYTVNLDLGRFKLEINVNLPLNYPHSKPEVFVRSDQLSRIQQGDLNKRVTNFVSEMERDEIVVGSLIAWLQENALDYFSTQNADKTHSQETCPQRAEKKNEIFIRMWIYSHHIYSKLKRKVILELAQDYFLTGFCLPGKPGIICLEGYKSDCEEWWQQVKSMTWKKIMCVKKEEFDFGSDVEESRKFSNFREISFNTGKLKKQDHHMDFGEFYKYLKENHCEYMFKEYFGIEGK